MSLEATLQAHTSLCGEIYDLMIEENRQLSTVGEPPGEALLERKRALLAALPPSLDRLRGASVQTTTPEIRSCIGKAMQIILKALLLDRENEQLLLKSTLTRRAAAAPTRPAASHLQRIYGRVPTA